jgi:hypothetical protein
MFINHHHSLSDILLMSIQKVLYPHQIRLCPQDIANTFVLVRTSLAIILHQLDGDRVIAAFTKMNMQVSASSNRAPRMTHMAP